MQIEDKSGALKFDEGQELAGTIQWAGSKLSMIAKVQWVNSNRVGVSFVSDDSFTHEIHDFLSINQVVYKVKPMHLVSEQ